MALSTPPDDSLQAANYVNYQDGSVYQHEPGVVVIPRVGNTPRAIRVHQPYSRRVRKVTATKDRTPPVVNAPAAEDTVLAQTIAFPLPVATGGNPPLFRFTIDATYVTLETGTGTPVTDGLIGGTYPMAFPRLRQAQGQTVGGGGGLGGGLGGIGGGAATPLVLTPSFSTGAYQWPFTDVSHAFFRRDVVPHQTQG